MQSAQILTELKSFLHDAGALALQKQQTAAQEMKSDATIVTEADLAISDLFKQRFGHYHSQPGHVLVDEETPGLTPADVADAEYQWIIDPIDGTATYAGGGPLWGTIVSVFKKGQPWVSAIYAPGLKLLHWADEASVFEQTEAFTPQAQTRQLQPHSKQLHAQSQIILHQFYVSEVFRERPCLIIDYWSPITSSYVAAGYLMAKITHASLWDVSGGWTFMRRLGYSFANLTTGEEIQRISPDWFDKKFRLSQFMFMGPHHVHQQLKPSLNPNPQA